MWSEVESVSLGQSFLNTLLIGTKGVVGQIGGCIIHEASLARKPSKKKPSPSQKFLLSSFVRKERERESLLLFPLIILSLGLLIKL